MAAIAFDPLEYSHQLEASGVPRAQAEVHARAMTAMFLHNFDALVTKDYLDSRFNEVETRIEAKLDKRLAEFAAGIDQRFKDLEAGIDQRFSGIDQRFKDLEVGINQRFAAIELRFAAIELQFERVNGRFNLLYWMQGLTMVCVVIPLLRGFLG
jgi:hypothetical protein